MRIKISIIFISILIIGCCNKDKSLHTHFVNVNDEKLFQFISKFVDFTDSIKTKDLNQNYNEVYLLYVTNDFHLTKRYIMKYSFNLRIDIQEIKPWKYTIIKNKLILIIIPFIDDISNLSETKEVINEIVNKYPNFHIIKNNQFYTDRDLSWQMITNKDTTLINNKGDGFFNDTIYNKKYKYFAPNN
jgi:hypothetical protein